MPVNRLGLFCRTFSINKIDSFLVTQNDSINWLARFPASDSWLLVTPKKKTYITDSRYELEAKKGLKGISLAIHSSSLIGKFAELAKEQNMVRIGYDSRNLSHAAYEKMRKILPAKAKLVACNQILDELRSIKDRAELGKITAGLKLHYSALKYLKRIIRPGITEQQVLLKLERYVKERGAGFSFAPIIASGPNSCFPHAGVTLRKIRPNEPVLVDFGIDLDGYKTDLTRMFFLGKIPKLITEYNTYVREAQHRAITSIRSGVKSAEVDYQARNFLKEKGLDKYFGHALGHGVGLEIHEYPRLSQKSPDILKENMVVTVEPAVYIPEQFGIRIEDMVLVRQGGNTVLSRGIEVYK